MPFQIIRNDITKVKADAIVNTANQNVAVGSGTDSAIYRATGEEQLLAERRKIGVLMPGQAAHTPAFNLDATYIIHTVGPSWIDGNHGEREILHSCYAKSLDLASELNCQSIAFPLIATGVYGFPKDEALQIALAEINRFLLWHDMKVILVVFDRKAFELSGKLVGDIEEYIDEHSAAEIRHAEYSGKSRGKGGRWLERFERSARRDRSERSEQFERSDDLQMTMRPGFPHHADLEEADLEDSDASEQIAYSEASAPALPELSAPAFPEASAASFPNLSGMSLDEVLGHPEDTFQQRLLRLIDESGMDDVTVYKKANIDRKVFSRIRCKEDYKPKKKTAVAFAIALRLDLPTMTDLLSRAEIAFSPSNKFDLIITYFVTRRVYDIYEINAALFKYGQPILGE